MTGQNFRKQLIYRANHRGIKEMDIVLGRFADRFVMQMPEAELMQFVAIMDEMDRDLLSWFTGEVPIPDHLDRDLMKTILDFTTQNASQ